MAEVKSIFNFLKDYNGLLNPIVTEIDRQIWSYNLNGTWYHPNFVECVKKQVSKFTEERT